MRMRYEIAGAPATAALDLRDVTLVDESAVKFLAGCEADSVKLQNCPAYIRAWIDKGKCRRNWRGK